MNKKPLVLIVDDENKNNQLIGKILNDNHYEVAIAETGEETLDFLEDNSPDLILLDIIMPDMNGYEICRKVKSNKKTIDIPIIFLSAKSQTIDLVEGFEAGGIDYITKPFKTQELLIRIKTHVKLKRTLEENAVLRGIVPICAKCKKVSDGLGHWEKFDQFINNRTSAELSHGLCPDCAVELYGDKKWFHKDNLPE